MAALLHLAAYKFVPLGPDLALLRSMLGEAAAVRELKGTVLLSHEGINLYVAGDPESVGSFFALLRDVPGLDDLEAKTSPASKPPYRRFRIKVKDEIIRLGVPGIDPARQPAPRVAPETLKQWLDEGRPVTLLDTRNDYEVRLGTFRGAIAPPMQRFSDFPAAVAEFPKEWKERTIVTFCTGGIRCEKAAPLLQRAGFVQAYQLDGGILKYFERCGSAHFDGELFVFDERIGLDSGLEETGTTLCPSCQQVVQPGRSSPMATPSCTCATAG